MIPDLGTVGFLSSGFERVVLCSFTTCLRRRCRCGLTLPLLLSLSPFLSVSLSLCLAFSLSCFLSVSLCLSPLSLALSPSLALPRSPSLSLQEVIQEAIGRANPHQNQSAVRCVEFSLMSRARLDLFEVGSGSLADEGEENGEIWIVLASLVRRAGSTVKRDVQRRQAERAKAVMFSKRLEIAHLPNLYSVSISSFLSFTCSAWASQ